MKNLKTFFIWSIILALSFLTHKIGSEIRKVSQNNKILHEIIVTTDFISFTQNGGGPFGYENYYKWLYSKWRVDPRRTVFEKIMFWNAGIFYEATNPPEEYEYPFLLLQK